MPGSIAGLGALTGVLAKLATYNADTVLHDTGSELADAIVLNAQQRLGSYQTGWEPLLDATIADRIRQGFAPDEPLLRSGEDAPLITEDDLGTAGQGPGLRGSLTWSEQKDDPFTVTFTIGVPSDSPAGPYAAVQELGSINPDGPIPPRPFLLPAAQDEAGGSTITDLFKDRIKADVGAASKGP